MNQLITIRERRQVTLPKSLLTKLGLSVGDKLLLKLKSTEIMIEPINIKTVDLLTKIQEIVKKAGISEKELQQGALRLRKKLTAQHFE